MATSVEYIEYVCDQIKDLGFIRYKKMFREYMVYVNDKPILLICNSTVFIKKLEDVKLLMQFSETGHPYEGAKEYYILDIDNSELVESVISILEPITPIPHKKSKKKYNTLQDG